MQGSKVELNEYYSNPFAKNEHKYNDDDNDDVVDADDNKSEYEQGNYIVSNKLHNDDDIDDACYAEIDLEENEHDIQSQINRRSNELTEKTQIEMSADNTNTTRLPTNWQHDVNDKHVSTRVSHESSIIARFKAALDEEVANASAMRDEYEKHIELLRSKVEQLTGENDHLQSTCMKLEGQLRALSLEKDNAEWVQEQQNSRTNALENRVEELEHELEQTQIRARKMVHEIEMTYKTQQQRQRPPSRQTEAMEINYDKCRESQERANELSSASIQHPKKTGGAKNKKYHYDDTKTIRLSNERPSETSLNEEEKNKEELPKEIQQPSAERFTNRRISNMSAISDSNCNKNNNSRRSTDRNVSTDLQKIRKDNDEGEKEEKEISAISKAAAQRRRASTPPWLPASDRSKEKQNNTDANTVRVSRRGLNPDKTAWMTDDEKEEQRARERVVVEQLETELLDHSKLRDELVSQLQRLESSRLKTVAERARKAAIENDLNSEEHVIGKLRLQLRSYSSLIK